MKGKWESVKILLENTNLWDIKIDVNREGHIEKEILPANKIFRVASFFALFTLNED